MRNSRTVHLIEPDSIVARQVTQCLETYGYTVTHYERCLSVPVETMKGMVLISCTAQDSSIVEWIRLHHKTAGGKSRTMIAVVDQEQGLLAADAMKAGATDYLLRPFDAKQLLGLLERVEALQKPLTDMVAESWRSKQVLQLAHRAAGTNATVLISGESGTGKEVLAQYVHQHSNRKQAPFIAVNCAAIPESMLEAVLFGHVKGAFTGAVQSQSGKFEEANGGTILLDEVAEMSPAVQAKLLRVLQEREVERVGSHKSIQLDIRVIAATNRDLRLAVKEGTFREDLYYRLDVLPLHWPPLRERPEDILPLSEFFIRRYQEQSSCCLSSDAKLALSQYHWPGNIRELENVIQRALVMRHGEFITAQDLMLPVSFQASDIAISQLESGHVEAKKKAEFKYIIDVLRQFGGNRTKTADALGATTRALRYKIAAMREQGIDLQAVLDSAA